MGTLITLGIGWAVGIITPYAKNRFIQVVKHFNEYLKKKINKM
jgi:uncharacterized membrane protein (Fun14 family)